MEAFYKQKWVQLVRPEVRMSNPPYPRREYATPTSPEPFFRDQAPGFMGIASSPGPVIATSASVGFDEPARPPEVENVFAPPLPAEDPVDVPLQAPGRINPLFEPRNAKAPPPKETRAERANAKGTEKRQEELNKRRFAPSRRNAEEFESFTANKRQMSRLGRDPPRN
jgi:hypothetical protein